MAVTVKGQVCERTNEGAGDTSTTIELDATPDEGDVIVLFVARSTGPDSGGGHDNASRSGFTLLQSFDPASTYDMYVDILYRESDGTEGDTHAVTMGNDAGEADLVKGGWIWVGADVSSITAEGWDFGNGTSHSFDADGHSAGGMTMHMHFTQSNVGLDGEFPTGDTGETYSAINWRNGGFATSGGNTASGSYSSAQRTWGNVWIDEGGDDLPTVAVTSHTDGDRLDKDTAAPTISGTASDDNGVDDVELRWRKNAGAWSSWASVTNTGTNYSTWNYTGITGLAAGDVVDIEVESIDDAAQRSATTELTLTLNEPPTIASISSPTAAQVFATFSAHPDVTINTIADDVAGNVQKFTYKLQRDSDGYYWDGSSAWQASVIYPATTGVTPAFPVTSYTFSDGVDGIVLPDDLGADIGYTFSAYCHDGEFGDAGTPAIVSFSVAPDVLNAQITSPADDARLPAGTTDLVVSGTASSPDTLLSVEVSRDNSNWFTATGTGSWTYTFSGVLTDGASGTVYARASDDSPDTSTPVSVDFAVNALSSIGSVTGITEGEVLAANAAMPSFTLNTVTDDDGTITQYRYSLQRLSDDEYWRDSDQTWQASQTWNYSSVVSHSTPASYTFADGVDGIELPADLGQGIDYQLIVQSRDSDGEWSAA